MTKTPLAAALALACPLATPVFAQDAAPADDPVRSGGVVTITANRPTSLPTEIPTTLHGATAADIERHVNATDSEDALKYFPSLLVRKRYIGDYNHAILSSRASGTGNSARSAVYADGILLSNYLGNGVGGISFPPRWEMVVPEEIERVDVMYGPFSAAYAGNSAGAVVDFVTRMPTRFEAHAKVDYQVEPYRLYATQETEHAWQAGVGLGDRVGALAWWIDASHTDSQGQPLTFATRTLAAGSSGGAGTPVTGAVAGLNANGQPWWLLGSATQYRSRQDHVKLKLSLDLAHDLRATYVAGLWRNASSNDPVSWLRDAAGNTVTSGAISIDGATYAGLTSADFPVTRERLQHAMHGLTLKRHGGGVLDWEASASLVDYQRDDKRQNGQATVSNPVPAAYDGGPGMRYDGHGTGWNTLAAKATWRPSGRQGTHVVDAGLQQDSWHLGYRATSLAGDWRSDTDGTLASDVTGRTRLRSAWVQDTWRLAPAWTAVLGGREEHWRAWDGATAFSATSATSFAPRRIDAFSPKAALSWQAAMDTVLKLSIGRAVRMPTVSELYGATSTANSQYINDPRLAPERSWTGELSAEHDFARATARATLFAETTRDAIYSQTLFDANANRNIGRVQNVGRIATTGVEAAFDSRDALVRGLDLSGSATWTDSRIRANAGFVATPGDTLGKRQPNIPRWRATALAGFRLTPTWSASVGARYSGRQYRTLDNADTHGQAYMGVSPYFTMDVRTVVKFASHWTAALGVDNANQARYWNFHPYPQRTWSAELKYDL